VTTDDSAARHRRARIAVWTALALIIGWLVIGSVVGPLAGKLSSAQSNDAATFLPANAEATKVIDAQQKIAGQAALPILVTFDAGGDPFNADQTAAVTAFAKQVPSLPIETGDASQATVGDYLVGEPAVIPSVGSDGQPNGLASMVLVNVNSDKAAKALPDGKSPVLRITESLRTAATAAAEPVSLTTHTAGPGGVLADLIKVFGDIDTKLLGVTALVVTVILILVYRSPFLWLLPLTSAGTALGLASGVVYVLASNDIVQLNGQSQGILTVLVFGAGTDYALLMVSRYREELHQHELPWDALRAAWRGTVEPIVASGATASLGLLMLLFSELNSNKSTGPIAAIGIASALVVMLTFLPALLLVPSAMLFLVLVGVAFAIGAVIGGPPVGGVVALLAVIAFAVAVVIRVRRPETRWAFWARVPGARWAFWPKVPHPDHADTKLTGFWSRIAGMVGRRSRTTWLVTGGLLLVLAAFASTLNPSGISSEQQFANPDTVDSVQGQQTIAQYFAAGLGSETIVIGPADQLQQMSDVIAKTPGVAAVAPVTTSTSSTDPLVVDGLVELRATLGVDPGSAKAEQIVTDLRTSLDAVSTDALVGGTTAINLDTKNASARDLKVVIPLVLLVILVVLILLLRAIVAPVLLIATVILSFLATLGISAIFFHHVFGFAGVDPAFPLFTFVFLVALGIDYNIFLMTRVREESQALGTRPGILRGLTVTGGVITSAGVVLAATFLVLGVLPLVVLREIGFAVAVGVLIDTLIVRSLLVPAASYDIGRRIWWPGRLAKSDPALPQLEPADR
jgi:putative drug exporter of the RND superfamily